MDIKATLIEIATREFQCPPEKMAPETPIHDMGIDSLGLMEFVFRIEETFGIDIGDEQFEKLRTLGDMVGLVESLREPALP